MATSNPVLRSAAIGALAGMRTFAPPAWLDRRKNLRARRFWLLASAFETVFDKLPILGSRTSRPQLLGRVLSGVAIAVVQAERDENARLRRVVSGATAAIAAVASTYVLHRLRRRVGSKLKVRDAWVGAAEDAVALGLGRALAG
jgi:uncharacterized membrane protein